MRYRKNINCLSADELHDLREALAAMYALPPSDPNSFATLASFHGGPPITYCAHGAPGFFTWHRAYLMAFENALRSVGCHVTLPYWNWSSGPTTGVPAACRQATYVNRSGATVPNPLYSGPRAGGGQTSRRANIDTTAFDDLATGAQAALTEANFASFQSQMNGVHGGVHVRTGGDMGSVPTAAYDPIFYLHHANIDRLWADWQAAHPGALPALEAGFELQPFPRPFSNQWQTGSDVESTVALGYRYRRFCFWLPPFKVWEVVAFDWPFREPIGPESVRVVLKAHHMQPRPVEIRAFLDQPDAGAQTKTIGNPSFAGVTAFFGHGSPDPHGEKKAAAAASSGHAGHGETPRPTPQPGVKERFDLELNITSALRARKPQEGKVALKLVAVDGDGNEVPADALILEGVSVEVE
ncbi:MAG TPA: tyrosinase family protein [Vicinamibacterales bacterium]|nr:tyrosinase family protein [Vicinamibacterales bacterium]